MYYTYMIRCSDNSIYTGITTDINRRFLEHKNKDKKCAKYTYTHDVVKLECYYISETRSLASRLEYYIKKLSKNEKEKLIFSDKNFELLFQEKLDLTQYKRGKI